MPESISPRFDAPDHRAFDFWLGDWEVRTPDGALAGTNIVTLQYDGGVLHERYVIVRQLWESTDEGGAWQAAFDGCYTRRGTPTP